MNDLYVRQTTDQKKKSTVTERDGEKEKNDANTFSIEFSLSIKCRQTNENYLYGFNFTLESDPK